MTADWFDELMGFQERSYEETSRSIEVSGQVLRSKANGRSYVIGDLETPTLEELRNRAAGFSDQRSGALAVAHVVGDVASLHREPANANALFQVASQFNLLEMTGPDISPEDGVTGYVHDRTQGPACALAAGAATIYRNYYAPVDGQPGQTRDRRVDCLKNVGAALGNEHSALWTMRNGYALCTRAGLTAVARMLERADPHARDAIRDLLRVGIHWGVQVTGGATTNLFVTQVFCSALPVSYTNIPFRYWEPFATLVLEGAYEATLWAGVLNAQRSGSKVVFLTQLGGGAFGNERLWIHHAIRRALRVVQTAGVRLDVRLVSYGTSDRELIRLVQEFA